MEGHGNDMREKVGAGAGLRANFASILLLSVSLRRIQAAAVAKGTI